MQNLDKIYPQVPLQNATDIRGLQQKEEVITRKKTGTENRHPTERTGKKNPSDDTERGPSYLAGQA